jgi:hypothetical protein
MLCGLEKFYFSGFKWAFTDSFYLLLFTNPQSGIVKDFILNAPLSLSIFLAACAHFVVQMFAPIALFSRKYAVFYWFLLSLFHIGVCLLMSGHISFLTELFVAISLFSPYFDKK